MVDGIYTYGAGTTVAGVVQEAATPQKRASGPFATDNTPAGQAETNAVQSKAIKKILRKETDSNIDFVSQAEAILNKALSLQSANIKLSIDVDDGSGLFVYKGIDKQSGEVVSQFPAKEILALIAYYREAEGIVVDEKV